MHTPRAEPITLVHPESTTNNGIAEYKNSLHRQRRALEGPLTSLLNQTIKVSREETDPERRAAIFNHQREELRTLFILTNAIDEIERHSEIERDILEEKRVDPK